MVFFTKAVLLTLGLVVTSHAKATILADTNRDGVIDHRDEDGKKTWTENKGALFLANIGDTDKLGSQELAQVLVGDPCTPVDEIIDMFHDAFRDEIRSPQNLAPLHISVDGETPAEAWGSIRISGTVSGQHGRDPAAGRVRIFHKREESWELVQVQGDKFTKFTASDLKGGVALGIDARDVRRPDVWDGFVTVTLDIYDRDSKPVSSDSVQLRVAPVLIQHALQPPKTIYIGTLPASANPNANPGPFSSSVAHDAFDTRMMDRIQSTNGLNSVKVSHENGYFWIRDWFAPGYMSMPGPGGDPIVLHVLVKSCRKDHEEDNTVFTHLRDAGIGAVSHEVPEKDRQKFENKYEGLGNLVVIPPYTDTRGVRYTTGRAIMGIGNYAKTAISDFINAQGIQNLLKPFPENHWLDAGHMDEYIQFLPVVNDANPRGWAMVVADPRMALSMMQEAQKKGKGHTVAFSHPAAATGTLGTISTIDDILRAPLFSTHNNNAAMYIEQAIDLIKSETGLTDNEIIRVPTLFHATKEILYRSTLRANQPDVFDHLQRRSVFGNVVNGISYKDFHYLAPRPWGPIVDGKDIFESAVNEAFEKHNYVVEFEDTWFSHHVAGGELHCGTNELRQITNKWWESPIETGGSTTTTTTSTS